MKNKKNVTLLALASMLVIGSLAMFTDYVSDTRQVATAKLAVGLEDFWDTTGGANEGLVAGHIVDLGTAKITNEGDVPLEAKVVVTVVTDEVTGLSSEVFKLEAAPGLYSDEEQSDEVGITMPVGDERTLASMLGVDNLNLVVDGAVGNEAQGRTGSVTIEIFARQVGGTTWPADAELIITNAIGGKVNP